MSSKVRFISLGVLLLVSVSACCGSPAPDGGTKSRPYEPYCPSSIQVRKTPGTYRVDTLAAGAPIVAPTALTLTAAGLMVADTGGNHVLRIGLDGGVSVLAGNGVMGAVDGPGDQAEFAHPMGIAMDGTSAVVADTLNCRIRQIDASGAVTTLLAAVPCTPAPLAARICSLASWWILKVAYF